MKKTILIALSVCLLSSAYSSDAKFEKAQKALKRLEAMAEREKAKKAQDASGLEKRKAQLEAYVKEADEIVERHNNDLEELKKVIEIINKRDKLSASAIQESIEEDGKILLGLGIIDEAQLKKYLARLDKRNAENRKRLSEIITDTDKDTPARNKAVSASDKLKKIDGKNNFGNNRLSDFFELRTIKVYVDGLDDDQGNNLDLSIDDYIGLLLFKNFISPKQKKIEEFRQLCEVKGEGSINWVTSTYLSTILAEIKVTERELNSKFDVRKYKMVSEVYPQLKKHFHLKNADFLIEVIGLGKKIPEVDNDIFNFRKVVERFVKKFDRSMFHLAGEKKWEDSPDLIKVVVDNIVSGKTLEEFKKLTTRNNEYNGLNPSLELANNFYKEQANKRGVTFLFADNPLGNSVKFEFSKKYEDSLNIYFDYKNPRRIGGRNFTILSDLWREALREENIEKEKLLEYWKLSEHLAKLKAMSKELKSCMKDTTQAQKKMINFELEVEVNNPILDDVVSTLRRTHEVLGNVMEYYNGDSEVAPK